MGKTDEQLLPRYLAKQCRQSDKETIKVGKPVRLEEPSFYEDGEVRCFDTIGAYFRRSWQPIGIGWS